MKFLAVCFFFCCYCCCLASSAAQRRRIPGYWYPSHEEHNYSLSEDDHRTYDETSVKQLSVNLTFDMGINLQIEGGYFRAHNFPPNKVRTEWDVMRSVYVVKRVTRGEESDPATCLTRGDPQGDQVPCKANAEGMFTCEQVIRMEMPDKWPLMAVLTTKYHSLSALEKNGSVCVYEVGHELSVIPEYTMINSLQTTDFLDEYLSSFVRQIHELHVLVEVDSKLAVGVVDVEDNCQRNRSANEDCQAFLRPYENAAQKFATLLQMALTPLLEQKPSTDNAIYSLAGKRERTFPNLLVQWKTMKVLNLASTGFSFIDDDYFKGVPQLTDLILSGNNFTAVPDGIKQLRDLVVLDLSNNPLKNMTQLSEVLQSLTTLKRLDLSGVPIGRLDSLYDGLRPLKLRSLNLRSSSVSVINSTPRNIFGSMTKLEHLDLSENPLNSIKEYTFSNMRALKSLHLSNANLSQSFKLHLQSTKIVDFIDLSYNRLTKVNTIDTCGTVKTLKIDHNLIEEWTDTDVFLSPCKRPWLVYLDVSHNNIKTISIPMRLSLQFIRTVDIGQNPVICKCDLRELGDLLNETKPRFLIGSPPYFRCVPIDKCVNEKVFTIENNEIYWYLLIPFAIGLIMFVFIKLLTSFRRYHLAYMQYLHSKKEDNRKKAVELSKIAFENDVYIVHSLEDTEWVNTVLVPRLRNYKVLVADPKCTDVERITNDIHNSRHLLFVVSDYFPRSQACMHRGLELGHLAILNEDHHNLIFLLMHEVNHVAFPTNLKLLSSTYDFIEWPKKGKSDAKAFKTLISYLGVNENLMWKVNLKNELIKN